MGGLSQSRGSTATRKRRPHLAARARDPTPLTLRLLIAGRQISAFGQSNETQLTGKLVRNSVPITFLALQRFTSIPFHVGAGRRLGQHLLNRALG
jgi:hypothetical protein